MISNRDVGFVEVGQEAAIKIDTFNFTRYGLLHGTVLTVSNDAIQRDTRPQDKQLRQAAGERRRPAPASRRRPGSLVYAARVSLDRTRMRVEDKTVNLSPGMAVTVEIETGSPATFWSYLLSPASSATSTTACASC